MSIAGIRKELGKVREEPEKDYRISVKKANKTLQEVYSSQSNNFTYLNDLIAFMNFDEMFNILAVEKDKNIAIQAITDRRIKKQRAEEDSEALSPDDARSNQAPIKPSRKAQSVCGPHSELTSLSRKTATAGTHEQPSKFKTQAKRVQAAKMYKYMKRSTYLPHQGSAEQQEIEPIQKLRIRDRTDPQRSNSMRARLEDVEKV